MSASRNARLEIIVCITAIVCVLAVILGRAEHVADDSLRQSVTTAAAHFQAGLSLLQARSRLSSSEPLNALGYPTGRSGRLQNDGDCETVWERVMQTPAAEVKSVFVENSDGSGDRCEYLFMDNRPDDTPAMRILYWPQGSMAAVVAVHQRLLNVAHGGHVHVDLG